MEPSGEIWSKLVPLDSSCSVVNLQSDEVVIHSVMKLSSSKLRWCKIAKSPDLCSAVLHNINSSRIYVDGTYVPPEGSILIKSGSLIIPGPALKGYLAYRFEMMPVNQSSKKMVKISLDSDHAKCHICLNLWHEAVSVGPCLHNFCNICFSNWWSSQEEDRHSKLLCPVCKGPVLLVGKNHFLRMIEKEILKSDSSFGVICDQVDVPTMFASKYQYHVFDDEKPKYIYGAEPACPQCASEYDGFQCNMTTKHLQCKKCRGMMPCRSNMQQHCLGCNQVFCAAYWYFQMKRETYYWYLNQGTSTGFSICNPSTFMPVGEWIPTITRIPCVVHDGNMYEQDITVKCLKDMGKTVHTEVFQYIEKMDNKEIDLEGMPLNNSALINSKTLICKSCFDRLVSFFLYLFRIDMPAYATPPRDDCKDGYTCKGQK